MAGDVATEPHLGFELLFFAYMFGGCCWDGFAPFLSAHAVRLAGMLMIQNWSVYHVTLLYNCNYVVFWSTTFFLGGRVMRTLLGELLRDPSGMMGPDLVALLAVALAQIAGSGAYLARGMLDNHRLGRLLACVLLPVCLWGCWRIALRRMVS